MDYDSQPSINPRTEASGQQWHRRHQRPTQPSVRTLRMISVATAINVGAYLSDVCLSMGQCYGATAANGSLRVALSAVEASQDETHRNTRVTSLAQGRALTAVRRYLRRRLVSVGPPHSPPVEVLSPAQAIDAARHSCQISKLLLLWPLIGHRLCVSQQTHARIHLPAVSQPKTNDNNIAFDFNLWPTRQK